ncbi:electron transport complex subunit RsxC [Alteromonas aestuariivivens]|uniref:Ion-translocating oxidoreductase complex subunit C n=2 Tax=Alteromonas aestuariivivens TaxID=1938339 RepID=A0A3D8M6D1_9ALTE|nr:electron transport complex subunit RsxC [Alteromonas aestuariivivens]RDV25181.1 electron transport complex subunit RsxC [Alteromonas aestuariivivens]
MYPNFDQVVAQLDSGRLQSFPGGVYPAGNKDQTSELPIRRVELASILNVPLRQHVGTEATLIVEPGQRVLKGQPLTSSHQPFAVPVHAPTSGEVVGVGHHVTAHPSGLTEQCVSLRPDGYEEWCSLTPLTDYQTLNPAKVVAAICEAGITGMGGAGFPTHIKTSSSKPIEFLVINGVECEPYITADDRLMREYAWQIRQGIDVLQHLVQPKMVLIAIEDNKPQAIEAMQIACQDKANYRVVEVETKYPAGGEKQLIQMLTGREVPRDGLPADIGILMFNVGTCYAVADAIFQGKPLIERVVTLTGGALSQPGNVWAPIGTPVAHLLNLAGYLAEKQSAPQVIMGGPMMGFTLSHADIPVVKITNCLLAPARNELRSSDNERACIRCSACADACPVTLLPQQLFWHAKAREYDKTEEYNLFDCIECGACAFVCPSEIPLVHYYRKAKAEIRLQRDEKIRAEKAKERFEARKARLEREKREREEKHRKAKEARLAASQQAGSDTSDKVAAALARAKAKRAALPDNNPDNSAPPEESVPERKTQVAAAIARAKAKKAAQQASAQETGDTENTAATDNDKQQRVAAAIARAKAKKAAQSQGSPTNNTPQPVSHSDDTTGTDADAERKKRVAAAVARAKAKKESQKLTAGPLAEDSHGTRNPPLGEASSAEDEKKRRIAAAVARAKARKEAQRDEK